MGSLRKIRCELEKEHFEERGISINYQREWVRRKKRVSYTESEMTNPNTSGGRQQADTKDPNAEMA